MADPIGFDRGAFMRRFFAAMREEDTAGLTIETTGPSCTVATAPLFELARYLGGIIATPEQGQEIRRLAAESAGVTGSLVQWLFQAYRLLAAHDIDLTGELT
jgi:hypothetical protein